jgi:putative tricarboxylic transport membrane protein
MNLIKNPKDFYAGVLFLGIGALAIALASSYGIGDATRMGPGYFPLLLGGGLCCLAVVLIFRGLALAHDVRLDLPSLRPVLLITLSAVVFAFILQPLGLFVAVTVLVFISAIASSKATLLRALLLAIVLASGSVGIFIYGLKLPIPAIGCIVQDAFADLRSG